MKRRSQNRGLGRASAAGHNGREGGSCGSKKSSRCLSFQRMYHFAVTRKIQSVVIFAAIVASVNCLHRTAHLVQTKYQRMMDGDMPLILQSTTSKMTRQVTEVDIENNQPLGKARSGSSSNLRSAAAIAAAAEEAKNKKEAKRAEELQQKPPGSTPEEPRAVVDEAVVEAEKQEESTPKEPSAPKEETPKEALPSKEEETQEESIPLDADGNSDKCAGKKHFLDILEKTGKTKTEAREACDHLPQWSEVTKLYGDKPIILGMERCEAYREKLAKDFPKKLPPLKNIRIDGLFNAGTNALAQNMLMNLEDGKYHDPDNMDFDGPEYFQKHGIKVFAGWGKHTLITHPVSPKIQTQLPVVLVRDPYRWMKSMCKTPYRAEWPRVQGHCPNLVVTDHEKKNGLAPSDAGDQYQVNVTINAHTTDVDYFDNMADYWSKWNQAYLDVDFPRLIVRFEDAIFHAEAVMDAVAECAGVDRVQPHQYFADQAKSHGLSSNFLGTLSKYGTEEGRYAGMRNEDIAFARTALSPSLMELFQYKHAHENFAFPPIPEEQ